MKLILLLIFSISLLHAELHTYSIKPPTLKSNKFMSIKILDTVALEFDDLNGISFDEISALAYNKDKLYALSNKGYLYHLKIKIKKNKISRLTLIDAVSLKRKNKDKRLKKKHRDAEGMVLIDDELYISFEREPRVDIFSLNGKKIKNYKIPKELMNIDNYQSKNKALESIAYSKKYGIITAPEVALSDENPNLHIIYAKDKEYKFKASANLSAMEFINNTKLLVMERSFNQLTRRRILILKEVNLKKSKKGICKTKILAVMTSDKGWNLDNFEGLTKVGKNKFLMISDDNRSYFQKTVLVLFEIK